MHVGRNRPHLFGLLASTLIFLLVACQEAGPEAVEQILPNPDPDTPQILGLERLGQGGLMAGSIERFHVRLASDEDASITWRASGGELEPEGSAVNWLLPHAREAWIEVVVKTEEGLEASARFDLGLNWLSNDARGAIPHPYPDTLVGRHCDLSIDPSGTPHIVYWDQTHPSIWYATWNGVWNVELIEGMGFNIGGRVVGPMAVTTSAAGVPHIAYEIDNRIHYATPDGAGSWTIERVDGNPVYSLAGYHVAIALDPANGNRPTITYARESAYRGTAIAWRTGPGSWSSSAVQLQNWTVPNGGLLFDAAGVAHLTVGYTNGYAVTWTEAGGFQSSFYRTYSASGHSYSPARIVLDGDGDPIVADHQGVWHRKAGVWAFSAVTVENRYLTPTGLAWDGARPHLAMEHDGRFELVTTDDRGYWRYTYLGSAPGNKQIGFDLDDDGLPRVCYGENGKVWFY